jgi:hypothetical protein
VKSPLIMVARRRDLELERLEWDMAVATLTPLQDAEEMKLNL